LPQRHLLAKVGSAISAFFAGAGWCLARKGFIHLGSGWAVIVNFLSLIENKRDGKILTPTQIQALVRAFTAGTIPDYQMAAFLMAVYFRGLNPAETRVLTLAMRDSGQVLKFPRDQRPLVDKHSTGGIGDKVSLPLVPLLACLGFRVPMISGRGLGITGGTLDKLDSIPGFQTLRSPAQILQQVGKIGCAICGQTDAMVPADKKIYALRDASGTVPSIPLITASILSKKLAENLDALVLDVKFGSAAFMAEKTDARKLARALVTLGNQCGTRTCAILTDMNTPLGRAAGNWLEVKESMECLEGCGPGDLRQLVVNCAAHLLTQTRKVKSLAAARKLATDCLRSGEPRKKWDALLAAQGANLKAFRAKLTRDFTTPVVMELLARRAGYVVHCDARLIGEVIRELGGGRLTKESPINHEVGIDRMVKPGERVGKLAPLCRVHAMDQTQAKTALSRLTTAFAISGPKIACKHQVPEIVV
jgi:pyrimidine-nucleoside phosphorylase